MWYMPYILWIFTYIYITQIYLCSSENYTLNIWCNYFMTFYTLKPFNLYFETKKTGCVFWKFIPLLGHVDKLFFVIKNRLIFWYFILHLFSRRMVQIYSFISAVLKIAYVLIFIILIFHNINIVLVSHFLHIEICVRILNI